MTTNRKCIVDNATLSGVERIVGESKIKNLAYKENDILCLEKLVTAILFSDRLIGIDDYKTEYRSAKLKKFDFIDFKSVSSPTYKQLSAEAADFARRMTFSLDGSVPAGDVVKFFETLRIEPQLRWDIFVSSEYLTLSFIVQDPKDVVHEQAIESIFRTEATDSDQVATSNNYSPQFQVREASDISEIKALVHTLASENPNFKSEQLTTALNRIMFGYGWAAERSYFYNSVAEAEAADVFLAPLRDAFCESCCRIDYPSTVQGLLETLKTKSQETIASILTPSGQSHFALKLPFFTSYLISKTDTPKQCIELALELRNHKDFQDCRVIFHNLDHLPHIEKTKELNGILKYLNDSCRGLMKKYAVSTENGLQYSLSLGVTGPSVNLNSKLHQLFRAHKNKPFTRTFRNIAQDMLNVERLGSLHEKVCSSFREHEESSYPKISTTPKFMKNKENEHSRPAQLE